MTNNDIITTATTTTTTNDNNNDNNDDDNHNKGAMCIKESLSDADLVSLEIYDNDMYVEPDCVDDSITELVVGCNFMGLGQSCRGCYMTCEGALKYIEDNGDEIKSRVRAKKAGAGR